MLSSGGARGLAHIGVLQELLDAGLVIDRVGGCSMGAFVGAMFAMGMSPAEIGGRCREELVQRPSRATQVAGRRRRARQPPCWDDGRDGRGADPGCGRWAQVRALPGPPVSPLTPGGAGVEETLARSIVLGSLDTASSARLRADLLIEPDTASCGMLEFAQLDAMVAAGRGAAHDNPAYAMLRQDGAPPLH